MKKDFNQPAHVITVQADRMFEAKTLLVTYWYIWSILLTAILIPLGLSSFRKIKEAILRRKEKKTSKGFAGIGKD